MLPIAFSEKQAPTDAELQALRDNSVQDLNEARKTGGFATFWFTTQNGPILPPWGTRERERQLRLYYRHEYGTLLQGAFMGLIKKVKSTPWVIDGGRNLTYKYQNILSDSQFEYGWGDFVSRFLLDYLRFDGGAYAEIIAPGDPLKAPTGPIQGIAHLDSYQCLPTGDPEYPVVYWSRMGKLHLMHKTRILHMVDMPDGDQFNPGYGLCALSRAIAVVERELLMGRYIASNLNDKPSPGFVIANNIDEGMRNKAFASYQRQQNRDDLPPEGDVVWLYNMDTQFPATLENFTFARPPEKFDYKTYVEIDVDMLALALGVDRQELWPLQSRSMGSGAQSEILAEKSKGKAFGDILISLERLFNHHLLPEELEFQFKTSDSGQAQQDANIAIAWTTAVNQAGARLGMQEGRQILTEQVEAFQDATSDDAGQLVDLNDLDVSPLTEQQQLNSPLDPAPASVEQAQPATQTSGTDKTPLAAKKDFDSTRAQFIANIIDLFQAGNQDDITRRRAGVVMRAQLNSAGKQVRVDGLEDGGVTTGLSDADLNAHTVWLAQQSGYVSDFLDGLYKSGLTDAQIEQHAEMWANKSLQSAYYEGLQSADANGLYEFTGTDGKESCQTCQDLKGTKMRMSEWVAQKLRPGVDTDNFDCGGWNCNHRLERVQKSA